jgi:CheY-like chemotaxis protein
MQQRLNSILLIDDDEPTNIFTRIVIEDADCTQYVHAVQGGQEALDYLSGSALSKNDPYPDLIFLDINMPAMDGWEFLDEFQKTNSENVKRPVIVMLTTSLNPDDRLKAEERTEVSFFETKPLTKEKLLKILDRYFSGGVIPGQRIEIIK